jgi:hypothetical protein
MVLSLVSIKREEALPWIRQPVTGPSLRRSKANSRPMHVEFVADQVTLAQAFLRVIGLFPISIILPMIHFHSFIYHQRYVILGTDSVGE